MISGSILSGGGSVPSTQATPESWVNMVNDFQKGSLSTRLGIPMIYGIDAVHGNNNVYKSTIFPHNVGLGVTRQVNVLCIIQVINARVQPCNAVNLTDFLCAYVNRDPILVKKIGAATALEVRATGIQYAFAPCIAVSI